MVKNLKSKNQGNNQNQFALIDENLYKKFSEFCTIFERICQRSSKNKIKEDFDLQNQEIVIDNQTGRIIR